MLKPEVSVGLIIARNNYSEVLLQLRKGSHAGDVWACPGGKMEMWETFEETAIRETTEEAGPDLKYSEQLCHLFTANTRFYDEHKQYIVVFMYALWKGGEPKVMEPEKCAEWKWWKWDALPENLIQGNVMLKEKFKRGLPSIHWVGYM